MAKITICDICGTDKNVKELFYKTGEERDSATGDYGDNGLYTDLCDTCELKIIKKTLAIHVFSNNQKELIWDFNKKFIKEFENTGYMKK